MKLITRWLKKLTRWQSESGSNSGPERVQLSVSRLEQRRVLNGDPAGLDLLAGADVGDWTDAGSSADPGTTSDSQAVSDSLITAPFPSLVVDGTSADDVFDLNFNDESLAGRHIAISGGTGVDSLRIGDTSRWDSVRYQLNGAVGRLLLSGEAGETAISLDGIEHIDDSLHASERVFEVSAEGDAVTLGNSETPGMTQLATSSLKVQFASPDLSLENQELTDDGSSEVLIVGVSQDFSADLTIDLGSEDTLQISDELHLRGGDLSVRAETIEISGAIISHDAELQFQGDDVRISDQATLLNVGGDVTISAAKVMVDGEVTVGGGSILLRGSEHGIVEIDGDIDASSVDGLGGTVVIVGDRVIIRDDAIVDASGHHGGGMVSIGKENATSSWNARHTVVEANAVISADALVDGDGGNIVVWSDETALIQGSGNITARGGWLSGDGGWIETSGRRYVQLADGVDVSAPAGEAGVWLIDPINVLIRTPQVGDTAVPPAGGSLSASVIDAASIVTALTAGATVEIRTDLIDVPDEQGDITIESGLDAIAFGAATGTLKLFANRDIILSAVSGGINATSGSVVVEFETLTGEVQLNAEVNTGDSEGLLDIAAGTAITQNGTITSTGAVSMTAGTTIAQNADIANASLISMTADTAITQNANITSSGTVSFDVASGDITMVDPFQTTATGSISYSASGDVKLSSLTSSSSTIEVVADSDADGLGGIADISVLESPNLTAAAQAVVLSAGSGIGSSAAGQEINLLVGSLSAANSATGDIALREADGLNIVASAVPLEEIDGLQNAAPAGGISLISDTGNIVVAARVNSQGTGDVALTSFTGTVDLNADVTSVGGNVELTGTAVNQGADIEAAVGVTVTAITDAIEMLDGTNTIADANITYAASTDVKLSVLQSDTGNVVVIAATGGTGSITDITLLEDANIVAATGTATLRAADGIGAVLAGDIDTTIDALDAVNANNGSVEVHDTDALDIVATGLANNAAVGNINVVAAGALSVLGVVEANGAGTVRLQSQVGLLNIDDEVKSGSGNVSLVGGTVRQDATVQTTGAGTIAVTATAGDIVMIDGSSNTMADGNVIYMATGDIELTQITTAGNISVDATGGSIVDGSGLENANVTAAQVTLQASLGVGVADDINTNVDRLNGANSTGDIVVQEANGLVIDGTGLDNSGGGVLVDVLMGTLELDAPIAAGGNGAIELNAVDGTLTIDDSITSDLGSITLTADAIQQNANVQSTTGQIFATADVSSVTMDNGTESTSGGNIAYRAVSNVDLSLLQSTAGSDGNINVTSDTGAITDGLAGDSANVSINSTAILRAVSGIDIHTSVARLDALNTSTDLVRLQNIGNRPLTLDSVINRASGEMVEVSQAEGALTIAGTVEADGDVSLTAVDDASDATPTDRDDVFVTSAATVISNLANITIRGGDDITVLTGASLTAISMAEISIEGDYLGIDPDPDGTTISFAGDVSNSTVNIRGNSDMDTFTVTPSANAILHVFGENPPDAPGDTLNVISPSNRSITIPAPLTSDGSISVTDFEDVEYESIEEFGFGGHVIVEGSGFDDTLTLNADSRDSGSFILATDGSPSPLVNLLGLRSFTFNALDGDDQLIVTHPTNDVFAPRDLDDLVDAISPGDGIHFLGGNSTLNPDNNPPGDMLFVNGPSGQTINTVNHVLEGRDAAGNNGTIRYVDTSLNPPDAFMTYSGVEEITDLTIAENRNFDLRPAAQTINLSAASPSTLLLESSVAGDSVANYTFANPVSDLSLSTTLTPGITEVQVAGLSSAYDADLSIIAGDDNVSFTAPTDLGPNSRNLNVAGGDVSVNQTLTVSSDIVIVALGDVQVAAVTATGTINVTSAGAIIDGSGTLIPADDGATNFIGDTVSLTAVDGIGAGATLDDLDDIDIQTQNLSATNSGAGVVNLQVQATGGSLLLDNVFNVGRSVILDVVGNLVDANGPDELNLSGGNTELRATAGIGSGQIGDDADIDTEVSGILAVQTTSGAINIHNVASLIVGALPTLNGIAILNPPATPLSSVTLRAVGDLTIEQPVSNPTGGNVTLAAEQNGMLRVGANVSVSNTDSNSDEIGNIWLISGNDLLIAENVAVQIDGRGAVVAVAGLDTNGGSVQDSAASSASLRMANGSSISNLLGEGDIILLAPEDIDVSTIDTDGRVVVIADYEGISDGTIDQVSGSAFQDGEGRISDANTGIAPPDGPLNISAASILLRAGSGVGDHFANHMEDIDINTDILAVQTDTGHVNVQGFSEMGIGEFGMLTFFLPANATGFTVGAFTGAQIDAASLTQTDITIRNNFAMSIDEEVRNSSGGNITLASDSLNVMANVTVENGDNDADLDGNLWLYGNSDVELFSQVQANGTGAVTVLAGTSFNGGEELIGAGSGNVLMRGTARIDSTDGQISILSEGSVDITTVETGGDVVVEARLGNISDVTPDESFNIRANAASLRAGLRVGEGVVNDVADIDLNVSSISAETVADEINLHGSRSMRIEARNAVDVLLAPDGESPFPNESPDFFSVAAFEGIRLLGPSDDAIVVRTEGAAKRQRIHRERRKWQHRSSRRKQLRWLAGRLIAG